MPGQRLGQRRRIGHDLRGVPAELRLRRLGEGHRLGRDHVLERAALQTREHRAVDLLGQVLPAEDGAATRAAQRLVRREGDHVGHAHRARVGTAGDEAGRVGGIEHEARADRVGDLAEGPGIDDPRVGRRARHNERRPLRLGQVGDLVEVDDLAGARLVRRLRRDAVEHEAPELGHDGGGRPVRQVAAVIEPHGEDGRPRFEQRVVDRQVGVRAGVRLHVGVVGPEQCGGPVTSQVLHLVDDPVAAVVAAARVALGVLVRQHRARRREHRRRREVLRGDQLQGRLLTVELLPDEVRHLGVGGQRGLVTAHGVPSNELRGSAPDLGFTERPSRA